MAQPQPNTNDAINVEAGPPSYVAATTGDAEKAAEPAAVPAPNGSKTKKKHIWIAVIVGGAALIAIVGGAVMGKNKHHRSTGPGLRYGSGSEDLYSPVSPPSTSTIDWDRISRLLGTDLNAKTQYSGSIPTSISESTSTPTSASQGHGEKPSPTPGERTKALRISGNRNLGAAVGDPYSILVWDLRDENKLWWKEKDGNWNLYSDRQFIVAPITVSTSGNMQMAFSVNGENGHIVYMHFKDGKWHHEWQDIEIECCTVFVVQPTVVSKKEGTVDLFNADSQGRVLSVSYDGTSWGSWVDLSQKDMERTTDREVALTSWGEDRLDVFAKHDNDILHMWWAGGEGWAENWEKFPDSSPNQFWDEGEKVSVPHVTSWCTAEGSCAIELVILNSGFHTHKLFSNGEWSEWTGMWATEEGYDFVDTQSLAPGSGVDGRPFAHLISRATSNSIYYSAFNGTNWGEWYSVWNIGDFDSTAMGYYPTMGWPTVTVGGTNGVINLVARNMEGNVMRYELPEGKLRVENVGSEVDGTRYDLYKAVGEWEDLGKGDGMEAHIPCEMVERCG